MEAEWVSALTSVLALLVSVWAVWLLYRTLGATREAVQTSEDAVTATREIGEAQTRAYLYIQNARYVIGDDRLTAVLEISNVGQSPARSVFLKGVVRLVDMIGPPERPRVGIWYQSDEIELETSPIMTSSISVEELSFYPAFQFTGHDGSVPLRPSEEGFNDLSFELRISWVDVFNRKHSFDLELNAPVDASPYYPAMERTLRGPLKPTVSKAEYGSATASVFTPKAL